MLLSALRVPVRRAHVLAHAAARPSALPHAASRLAGCPEVAAALSARYDLLALASGSARPLTTSVFMRKRLRALEEEAERSPDDPGRVLAYYDAANRAKSPALVVRHFETGAYAADDAVAKEYIKALSALGRLDRLDMGEVADALDRSGARSALDRVGSRGADDATRLVGGGALRGATSARGMLGGGGGATGSAGTPDEPVHVVFTEPLRAQLWRIVRNLALAGVIMLMITMVLEERGLARGGSSGLGAFTTDVKPVTNSSKTFDDVVGVDEVKAELQEIVRYLRSPKTFTRLGGKLPKGVMLTGPPGTGKTLLARAVAGEAGVPFFYMSGSEFEEVFVGVGARRVRDLFTAAKARSPCIIFIDEIDAIGSHRNPKDQQAMKMTLNQLLVELDGFNQNEGVIVIGATNFPEVLDRALVRPGRFDTMVNVPLPDVKGRAQILSLHAKPITLGPSVDLERIARATPGFSGADLHNLMNMAALKASLDGQEAVGMSALEYACDKIRMGAERKSAHISEENLRMTAYHEGGHALVALHTKGAMPIHKATIVPRGMALGMVSYLPEKDQLNMSREQMLATLDVAMGGRIAEEIIFGPSGVTTGAQGDLATATSIARNMVTKYGMSDVVGPIYAPDDERTALAPATRELIDKEVQKILEGAAERARHVLKTHVKELHLLAAGLQKYETLSKDEIAKICKGEQLPTTTPERS